MIPPRIQWVLAVLAGLCLILGVLMPNSSAQGVAWRTVQARDGSFQVQVPSDWRVASAEFRSFEVWSPLGERVAIGAPDIFADRVSWQNAAIACRQAGCPTPPRVWSAPLSPVDVVRALYPLVGGGRIQGMKILRSRTLLAQGGTRAAAVYYQYTLAPRQAPMEGRVLVITLVDPFWINSHTGINFWTTIYQGAEGPQQYFVKRIPLYIALFQTLHYNPNVLKQYTQAPIKFGEEMSEMNRRIMQARIDAFGGVSRVKDPQTLWEGTIPWGAMPDKPGLTKWWYGCATAPQGLAVWGQIPPDLDCREGPPP